MPSFTRINLRLRTQTWENPIYHYFHDLSLSHNQKFQCFRIHLNNLYPSKYYSMSRLKFHWITKIMLFLRLEKVIPIVHESDCQSATWNFFTVYDDLLSKHIDQFNHARESLDDYHLAYFPLFSAILSVCMLDFAQFPYSHWLPLLGHQWGTRHWWWEWNPAAKAALSQIHHWWQNSAINCVTHCVSIWDGFGIRELSNWTLFELGFVPNNSKLYKGVW